jgi:hypothetical protein
VAGALGKGPQITLLAIAALVIGADAAVDRDFSQLNLSPCWALWSQQKRRFVQPRMCIKSIYV